MASEKTPAKPEEKMKAFRPYPKKPDESKKDGIPTVWSNDAYVRKKGNNNFYYYVDTY